jgi:glycosyltransferase involved in cell wall biosynthesis|tara:strand:- start:579 stop:1316 length:738 start_codon:yes stop_codon:yes gene_type:complete
MTNLSIILSTYNEEENISKSLEKIINNKIVDEIIIIDDNSSDNTVNIIKTFNNDKIKLFIRKRTKGFASAFIFGLFVSSGKYILRFDVDMHSQISFFLESFKKYNNKECVIFSRYVENGNDLRGSYRKISSLILNKTCQYLLSGKIKDYTSCIMFFKRDLLKDVIPNNTSYANFIIEFVFDLILKNKEYLEVGYTQTKSTEMNSKSAPNILNFLKNGFFYLISIFRCILLKSKFKLCILKMKMSR